MRRMALAAAVVVVTTAPALLGQARNSPPLPPLPQTLFTAEQPIRVSAVATGLSHPWSLAFLPDPSTSLGASGVTMLVTERAGRLRIIRNGVLDPQPVAGVPPVRAAVLGGLLDVALHPRFVENRLLYLSYTKAREDNLTTTALVRGRFDGKALADVQEIFVANNWSKSTTNYGGRIAFDRGGALLLTIGERQEPERAQNGRDHGGKVLRLRDDGSVPPDNPFAGRPDVAPEVYSLGHRSPQGLAVHPDTGAIWENEHGPLGGDEINIVLPGRNYGWPLVTFGTDYDGKTLTDATSRADLESPFMYFVPSIAISGMAFYTGDRFPAWKGNLFVGGLFEGRTRGTGHLRRITFNEGRPIQREPILIELRQRIRDVRQGPDGLLYVLTDEDNGAVLKIEPAPQLAAPNSAGVAMGHLHYRVKDVEANKRFWVTLGGVPIRIGDTEAVKFQDVIVALSPGESSGTSEGAVLNHIAFRVPSFAALEAVGIRVARLAGFPGVGNTQTPEGERVELFEDAALNLTFTPDDGKHASGSDRHNRPVGVPIAFHHVHLYVPGDGHLKAKDWYVRMFGAVAGKRAQYDAADLPGINFNFNGGRTSAPMKGRTLEHIGFEVRNLEAFCQRLVSLGVTFDQPCQKGPNGVSSAVLTDPWGTTIELTEGLRAF